jgi:hypothetical protein
VTRLQPFVIVALALALLTGGGCRSTYYSTMEAFGKHKRDLLVDRVGAARTDQAEAKEQFRSALERFESVVRLEQTDLKRTYDTLHAELERSQAKAGDVRERIASIEQVSADLFEEWEDELDQYTNRDLRRASERQLGETKQRCNELIAVMKRAEAKMEPVLASFRDHVLFLKHNLNAQAVAALRGELDTLENDTSALIREMETAIAEADAFIREMRAEG